MSVQLKEAREKLIVKQDALGKIFEEADDGNGGVDLNKVKCLGKDYEGKSIDVAKKIKALNDELKSLTDNVKEYEAAEAAKGYLDDLNGKPIKTVIHPESDEGGANGQRREMKSAGQQFVENDVYKNEWAKGNKANTVVIPEYGLAEIKTLFQTSAGWAPESTRLPGFIPFAVRPIQVIDLIPSGATGQNSIKYMEETTFTNAAAEVAEDGTYAESAFALTEKSSPVEKIGTWIPVTDEQLQDVAEAGSYLDNRLQFGVRQRLDSQILVGDGSTPNLEGFLNVSGIQTQAKGIDPVPDAIYKAITLVRVTGRALPNAVILHPNDWQTIRLLRTSDDVYIWGPPSEQGTPRIWGLPIVETDAITENTGLVGDYANFTQLFERRGLEVKITDSHSDFFIKGKQAMRADIRVALAVYRPAALCTVTGI